MSGQPAAQWYPDPSGRHQFRYWDGRQWTPHVTTHGRPGIDPLPSAPAAARTDRASQKIQRDVRKAGATAGATVGHGPLFHEPVLVVSQKAKLVEVNAEYVVYDQTGRQIGAVRQVGRSLIKNAMVVQSEGQRTIRMLVVDAEGRVVIALTRPAKILRSKIVVRDGPGAQIGEIAQKSLGIMGRVRFDLEAGGQMVGSINTENRKASDFSVQDASGDEIARITKRWAGLAKELFTKGDKYVVQIHRPLEEPLRSLVLSAALAVDTVLHQGGEKNDRR